MTPQERSLRARVGALSLHAQGKTSTEAASKAFQARFERQVDPDGTLPIAERARRAGFARRAYMSSLALKSARARSRSTGPEAVA